MFRILPHRNYDSRQNSKSGLFPSLKCICIGKINYLLKSMLKISELACLLDWTIYNPRSLASFSSCFIPSLFVSREVDYLPLKVSYDPRPLLDWRPRDGVVAGQCGNGPAESNGLGGSGDLRGQGNCAAFACLFYYIC